MTEVKGLNNLLLSDVAAKLHELGSSLILNSAFHANHIPVCFKALITVLWPREEEKLEKWASVDLDKLWVRGERQWSGELMSSPSRGQEFKLCICRMGGPKTNVRWFKIAEEANVQDELPWRRTQAVGGTRLCTVFCSNELQGAGKDTQRRMQRGQISVDFIPQSLDGLTSGACYCIIVSWIN